MKFKFLIDLFGKVNRQHVFSSIFVFGFLVLSVEYIRLHQEFTRVKEMHAESLTLVGQMRQMKFQLTTLDKTLQKLNRFSSKLSMIAQVKEPMQGVRVVQNGFHLSDVPNVIPTFQQGILPLGEKIDLDPMEIRLEDLKVDAQTQLEKYEELEAFYDENKTLLASIPSLLPAKGYIASDFGFRRNPNGTWRMHEGIDVAAYYGNSVIATADGLVEEAGYAAGYGRYVVMDHGFGLKTRYGHASRIWVKAGDFVKRGQKIASVGKTGRARGVHVHYEVLLNQVPLDPKDFIF